jgi:hypothetical protein
VTTVGTLRAIYDLVEPLVPPEFKQQAQSQTDDETDDSGTQGRSGSDTDFDDEICDRKEVLPHRQWALATKMEYGEVTILAAPGEGKKTTMAIARACELASGKALIGDHIFQGAQQVLYISKEDPTFELKRRLQAAAQGHNISQAELNNIRIIGNEKKHIKELARTKGTEAKPDIDRDGFATLKQLVKARAPRIVILDNLNLFIPVGSNSNTFGGKVELGLKEIAQEFNLAVLLVAHLRKDADRENVDSIRGAGAWKDHARSVLLEVDMTEDERVKHYPGVAPENLFRFFREVNGKSNNAPPVDSRTCWYELVSIDLNNPEPPYYPKPDNAAYVAVANPITMRVPPIIHPTFQRLMLEVIDKADKSGIPLTLNKQGNSQRYIYLAVEQEQQRRGAKPISEAEVKRIAGSLLNDGLIVEKVFKGLSGRNDGKGVCLTPKGKAQLLPTNGDDPPPERSPKGETKNNANSGKTEQN